MLQLPLSMSLQEVGLVILTAPCLFYLRQSPLANLQTSNHLPISSLVYFQFRAKKNWCPRHENPPPFNVTMAGSRDGTGRPEDCDG